MNEDAESKKLKLLQKVIEASERKEGRSQMSRLPKEITIHAIERTQTFGAKKPLEGEVIVELPDGSLHRLTGKEASDWSDAIGPFLRQWRLPE